MVEVDVCVLGSGPGGYVAAIKAGQCGLSVACVEKENVGGICLNWGCIPTKALLHCAESCNIVKKSKTFGIELDVKNIDIKKIVDYSRSVVQKLSDGVSMLFKKNKVKLIRGVGCFKDKNTLEVDINGTGSKEVVKAKYFIIATGASPRVLDYEIDNELICTYRGAMVPKKIPKEVAIIGGGVIGIEFASFYNAIGSKVHVLEIAPDILTTEDGEIRKKAKNCYIKNGIDIHTSVTNLTHKKQKDKVIVKCKEGNNELSFSVDKLILSIGVIPNVHCIGLENVGIELDKNCIKTNKFCRTNIDNIYAIGDCTYGPWLAHKASREGIIAVDDIDKKIKNKNNETFTSLDRSNIPSCIYSFPQIASIGFTEEQAKEKGLNYVVGTFNGVGNGKSIATSETDNFVKVLFDKNTHELLGVHMIGGNMTEIIHTLSIAKSSELLPEDIEATIFAHPTVSEMIPEAIMDAFGRAIHK